MSENTEGTGEMEAGMAKYQAKYHNNNYRTVNQNANISEAYDLSAFPYYQDEIIPERVQKKRIKIRKRVKSRPVYVRYQDQKRKISIQSVITVLLIFAGGLSIALSYAMVSNVQSNLLKMQNQLKERQEHNISLRADVAENYNLGEIERIATTNLGMSKAKPYQTVYINVSKQSYAVRSTSSEETAQSLTFSDVIGYIKNKLWRFDNNA